MQNGSQMCAKNVNVAPPPGSINVIMQDDFPGTTRNTVFQKNYNLSHYKPPLFVLSEVAKMFLVKTTRTSSLIF